MSWPTIVWTINSGRSSACLTQFVGEMTAGAVEQLRRDGNRTSPDGRTTSMLATLHSAKPRRHELSAHGAGLQEAGLGDSGTGRATRILTGRRSLRSRCTPLLRRGALLHRHIQHEQVEALPFRWIREETM